MWLLNPPTHALFHKHPGDVKTFRSGGRALRGTDGARRHDGVFVHVISAARGIGVRLEPGLGDYLRELAKTILTCPSNVRLQMCVRVFGPYAGAFKKGTATIYVWSGNHGIAMAVRALELPWIRQTVVGALADDGSVVNAFRRSIVRSTSSRSARFRAETALAPRRGSSRIGSANSSPRSARRIARGRRCLRACSPSHRAERAGRLCR
jgi:hypothetical protein